jgi:nicotinate phosphoribosyltransferase
MGVSADAPYHDIAYKLVKYDGRPVLKLSTGKETLVDKKQVFRTRENGRFVKDCIALRNEELEGEPLLLQAMERGRRVGQPEPVEVIRERFAEEFSTLDEAHKVLENPKTFPVELGLELKRLQKEVIHEVIEKELGES